MLDVPKNTPAPDAQPMDAALSPDGNALYVSCGRGGSVAVVHVPTLKQTHLFEHVGERPRGIGVSRDGKRFYTANGPSDDLSVVGARLQCANGTAQTMSRHSTGGELQQSPDSVQAPPRPTHAS